MANDILSAVSIMECDSLLRLSNCDLKSISYLSSQLKLLYSDQWNSSKQYKVLSNVKSNHGVEHMSGALGSINFKLPYSEELEEQYLAGNLFADMNLKNSRDFRKEIEKIEAELPRFVATITQELKASRDVVGILENYKKNAGEAFGYELDVLTADMRSGSYEAALTRFEARLNSPMLSDITRGLISVLRGDDGGMYFQMLSHDMKQLELQRLKAKAMKIPPKIRVFSFLMLMCFVITYVVIIISEILRSLSGLF
ncbi:MAG TPA: hypothetical protein VJY54_08305 [Lachnospiraceae bacterium]|nr:hypothetical protein [Lachnospiraceae bacterium]